MQSGDVIEATAKYKDGSSRRVRLLRSSVGWYPLDEIHAFTKAEEIELDDGDFVKPHGSFVRPRLTLSEWKAEAARRFGPDFLEWAFECPSCGYVARAREWKNVGAGDGEVAFSCIGRHLPKAVTLGQQPGPCNYAGGGLFKLNPVDVVDDEGRTHDMFAFATIAPRAEGASE